MNKLMSLSPAHRLLFETIREYTPGSFEKIHDSYSRDLTTFDVLLLELYMELTNGGNHRRPQNMIEHFMVQIGFVKVEMDADDDWVRRAEALVCDWAQNAIKQVIREAI